MICFKAGQILCVSDGEYSDYRPQMLVVACKDFTAEEAETAFKQSGLSIVDNDDAYDEFEGFRGWLVKEGYVVPLAASEWWVGAYGEFDHQHSKQFGGLLSR